LTAATGSCIYRDDNYIALAVCVADDDYGATLLNC